MKKKIISIFAITLIITTGLSSFFGITAIANPSSSNYYEDSFTDASEWICYGDVSISGGALCLALNGYYSGYADHNGYINTPSNIYKVRVECAGTQTGFNTLTTVDITVNGGSYTNTVISYGGNGGGYSLDETWDVPTSYQGNQLDIKIGMSASTSWIINMGWIKVTYWYNGPPNTPGMPSGPSIGNTGTSYTYSTSTIDPDNDQVYYMFDWGDGSDSGWVGPYNSGQTGDASHSWSSTGAYSVKAKAKDTNNAESGWSDPKTVTISNSPTNNPPNPPVIPSGPTSRGIGESGMYSTYATDPDGDLVQYRFDWDDGVISGWTTPLVPSGTYASKYHSWSSTGTYHVKAMAKDFYGAESAWSDPLIVTVADTDPPTPNPSTWDETPSATGPNSISMKATQANDPSGGVQYSFEETTGHSGGSNSGWQSDRSYTDDGLQSSTQYTYKVRTRDTHWNTGSYSTPKSATTNPINNAPYVPNNPYPSHDSEGIPLRITLSWDGGDPDGDTVTYDLYISNSPEPDCYPAYVEELTVAEYENMLLCIDLLYFWKVIATDEHGEQTEGPIWNFSTQTLDQIDPPENSQPIKPVTPVLSFSIPPNSNNAIYTGSFCVFLTNVVDPDGDNVTICWDMDGDTTEDFVQLDIISGAGCTLAYYWNKPPGTYNIRVIATDILSDDSEWSDPLTIYVYPTPNNNPPTNASIPAGEDVGYVNQPYTYTTFSVDPEGHDIKYQWDFGDGTITEWDDVNYVASGTEGIYSHIWDAEGYYDVRVRAKDINEDETPWSEAKTVSIVEHKTAKIFNRTDFMGIIDGDRFDNFPGEGRLIYADGPSGKFVTAAYAGFPVGHAWSAACQGVRIHVGRTKELKIDAEITYIGGTESTIPFTTWLEKVIKVGDFYFPEKEYKEGANNVGTIADLTAFCTGMISLLSYFAPEEGTYLYDLIKNHLWTETFLTKQAHVDQTLQGLLVKIESTNPIGPEAVETYRYLHGVITEEGSIMVKGGSSAGATASSAIGAEFAGQPVAMFGNLAAILYLAFVFWTGYQIGTHWQLDTLLEKFEKSGQAHTEHITKTFTFEPGDHNIWAGMHSNAIGALFAFGISFASGEIKSITIEGYAPPETPTLVNPPPAGIVGKVIDFKCLGIDQNDDPVRYIIDWGDGSNTITGFFPSGEVGIAPHEYLSAGLYTITVKSEDCDELESKGVATTIIQISKQKNNENSQSSSTPTQQTFPSSQQPSTPLFFQILQRQMNIR